MKYLEGLQLILSETTVAGDGAVWGATSPEGAADMQGDFYAPGNAMSLFGDPREPAHKGKKKKKKAKKKFPLYKRAFLESLDTEDDELILDCVIVTEQQNQQFVEKCLIVAGVDWYQDSDSYFIQESEQDILHIVESLSSVVGDHNFADNFSVFIGEFDLPTIEERVTEVPKCKEPYSAKNIKKSRESSKGVGEVKHSKDRSTMTSRSMYTNRQRRHRNKV